ncbi:MAG TPA: hypothetical protein VK692_04375, partial [Chthoniobacterales bacterium]|nr:hypothetical protein [Chthoniobacterales bacterium]
RNGDPDGLGYRRERKQLAGCSGRFFGPYKRVYSIVLVGEFEMRLFSLGVSPYGPRCLGPSRFASQESQAYADNEKNFDN